VSSTDPAPSEGSAGRARIGSIRTASNTCCELTVLQSSLRTASHHQRAVSCVLNRTDLSTEAVVTESLTPSVL
jgi:hypothetical protein